ncbi:M50 family metallopeptidase [Niallia endozanthoxylica]|uniref:Stage IV sporulation protein FB n=1 Tax=Niallia endozanthoxylica TaxID=2036016 RepID=A0A5J5HQ13_9BACI|nr:M50 family metallopeptidase [Niallia endozanthoxylica]KAA9023122.1 stage IV sporulation protein FB [Niallia endozanthoxylica]
MTSMLTVLKSIHIHPLLWLVMAFSIWTAHFIELSLFLFIVMMHELGHACAAAFFSWRIKRISLLPFGGVAEVDEHGNRPLKEEALVTLAGPLQHLWMIGLAFILYQLSLMPEYFYMIFVDYNLMVLLFNLLPIWPLDGGKLVYLWRSQKESFPIAHSKTVIISAVSLLLFFMLLLIIQPFNLNMWIVIGFLSFSLFYEWKQRRYVFVRFLLERYYGNKMEFKSLKHIYVHEDESVIRVLEQFQRGCKHLIIIEKEDAETEQLDENELLHAYFSEKMLHAKIGELLYPY